MSIIQTIQSNAGEMAFLAPNETSWISALDVIDKDVDKSDIWFSRTGITIDKVKSVLNDLPISFFDTLMNDFDLARNFVTWNDSPSVSGLFSI